jgi:hypothetical protein
VQSKYPFLDRECCIAEDALLPWRLGVISLIREI